MHLCGINTKLSESLMGELLSACPPPLHDEEISLYALSFSLRNDRGVAVVWTYKGPFPDAAISDLQQRKQLKEPATNNVGNC